MKYSKIPHAKNYLQSKKAVIFDIDGTLINSEPLHAQALCLVLKQENFDYDQSSFDADLLGLCDDEVFKKLLPETPARHDHLITKKNNILNSLLMDLNQQQFSALLTPGIYSFLDYLESIECKIAVVSASERSYVDCFLSKSKIGQVIETSVSRNDTALSKPDPMPYLKALESLKMLAQDVLIIEDSEIGLEAATHTGADVMQVITHSPQVSDIIANFENSTKLCLLSSFTDLLL